ncbi:hypothetical protein CN934_21815 [Ensifer sp. MMN_5]|nr:hypothetical protein CN934_21815 [Ensifer sp. MMN_5]PND24567.1 hypothetical protein CN933_26835 [Sinorhizobium sp. M4_45]
MRVTGIQQRRVCGAEEPFQPKDLVWLDSCDKHRNEGPGMCEAGRDAVQGRDRRPSAPPRYLHDL